MVKLRNLNGNNIHIRKSRFQGGTAAQMRLGRLLVTPCINSAVRSFSTKIIHSIPYYFLFPFKTALMC